MNKIFILFTLIFVILIGLLIHEEMNQQENIPEIIETPQEPLFIAQEKYTSSNQELQYYLPSHVEIKESQINMKADVVDDHYVSGCVESKVAYRYGTFAFKVNTIEGKGLFPAIWLLPNNHQAYPEIDIYELIGNQPYEFYGVLHYLDNAIPYRDYFSYDFSDHIPSTYTIKFEWTPNYLIWYLNDEVIYIIEAFVPDVPMYFIMNLAIGGNWPGNPDDTTSFPTTFTVEIVEFNPKESYTR